MRRGILVVVLGGALVTAGACTSDATRKPPAAAPTAETPTPSLSPLPDYASNTKRVCGNLQKIFDVDLKSFGERVGKMIAYKEAKKTPEAAQAQKAAGDQLRAIGTKVKKETEVAQNPELQIAGATSAAKFIKSAGDPKFLNGIKSTKDLDRTLETKMTEWLNPVAGYCA
jgi:hypothetical protein